MRSLKSRTGVSCGSTAVAAARCGLLLHLLCGWYSDAAWEGGGGMGYTDRETNSVHKEQK